MEIGSEFWIDKITFDSPVANITDSLRFGMDNKLVFLGRTAIDLALNDILKTRRIESVYFPSYCCASMLQPFLERNITVYYYNVSFENAIKYNISVDLKFDIFFAMNYFGYQENAMDYYISEFKEKGCTIIEDCTHSLLSDRVSCDKSDYIVVSLRKWFALLSGGLACKVHKNFHEHKLVKPNQGLVNNKLIAMIHKGEYLRSPKESLKEQYIYEFEIFNQQLPHNYRNCLIDGYSQQLLNEIDYSQVRKSRIDNCKIIYYELSDCNNIELLCNYQHGDCPLFIPILLEKEKRDYLRQILIDNKLYCPIHWPKPNEVCNSNIYDREISLICDQRYTEEDMFRIADIIKKNV